MFIQNLLKIYVYNLIISEQPLFYDIYFLLYVFIFIFTNRYDLQCGDSMVCNYGCKRLCECNEELLVSIVILTWNKNIFVVRCTNTDSCHFTEMKCKAPRLPFFIGSTSMRTPPHMHWNHMWMAVYFPLYRRGSTFVCYNNCIEWKDNQQ